MDPSCEKATWSLGAIGSDKVKGQDYDERSCYEKALELDPSCVIAWCNLGAVGGGKVNGQDYDLRPIHV